MGLAFKLAWSVFAVSVVLAVASFATAPADLAAADVLTSEMRARTPILHFAFYPGLMAFMLVLATAAMRGKPEMKDTRFRNVVLVGTAVVLLLAQLRYDTHLSALAALPGNFFQFVGFLAGLLLIVAGNYLPKAVRADALDLPKPWSYFFTIPWTLPFGYLFGVRTWWTLASEHVWNRTHRLAGRLWMISGAGLAAASWFTDISGYTSMIAVSLILNIVIPILYSFLIRDGAVRA